MKKNLFMMLLVLVGLASCNEPDKTMRDNKKLPELIEHCLTLSNNEIISYMQDNGYSLARNENEGTAEEPHCYLMFFPTSVLNQHPERGEELAEIYNEETSDPYIAVSFETTNFFISGTIAFNGDHEYKMTLYKAYTEWAYKNLPEFSSYSWKASIIAGEDFIEGSIYKGDTYGLGGYKEYMQALSNDTTIEDTFNYALGPDNIPSGVILPDYEILLQPKWECYYSRTLLGERK